MTAPTAPRVFIVDDDASVRKSLARIVRAAGFEAEVFASAREFLARAPHSGPCCLVLDVRMPGLTGIRSLTSLEDRWAAGPARPVLHPAARGKLLDRAPLSADSRGHRAAGVASDVIEPERAEGRVERMQEYP